MRQPAPSSSPAAAPAPGPREDAMPNARGLGLPVTGLRPEIDKTSPGSPSLLGQTFEPSLYLISSWRFSIFSFVSRGSSVAR